MMVVVEAASCVTTNVAPPIDRFALRAEPVLIATEYETVALPVPLVADDTVSHEALLEALQVQPAPVAREVDPVVPAAAALALVGLSA